MGLGSWKEDLDGRRGRKGVGKEEGKRFGFYKVKEIYFLRS